MKAVEFFESLWDKIYVVNLDKRQDRWKEFEDQAAKFGLTKYERIRGIYLPGNENCTFVKSFDPKMCNHHFGCTSSHRKIFDLVDHFGYKRTFVFEDDVRFRFDDTFEQFQELWPNVPEDWDMLYLGGHYACEPERRINKHVIKFKRMFTTSSYAITLDFVRCMGPYIAGSGQIDGLISGFTERNNCYILQPRLMVQRPSFSEIAQHHANWEPCMTDTRHENMV